jgi:hypothetical protein
VKHDFPCMRRRRLLAPQAMAGVLLVRRCRLPRVWSLEGRYGGALTAFALGCLLAVPPALMNVSGITVAMASDVESSFRSVWAAFYALSPALLEEAWVRLFLLPLLFVAFRSAPGSSTGRSLFLAVLPAVAVHGLAHAPHSITSVTTALAHLARVRDPARAALRPARPRVGDRVPLLRRLRAVLGRGAAAAPLTSRRPRCRIGPPRQGPPD